MDRREGTSLSGKDTYFLNRGRLGGSDPNVSVAGGGSELRQASGVHSPAALNPQLDAGIASQPGSGVGGGAIIGSTFHVVNPPPNFPSAASSVSHSPGGDSVKKKRGRPRKYGPGDANMSPLSSTPSSGAVSTVEKSGEKSHRGRPPGTGRKQQLALLGEWMNSSAGQAFTPHVLHIRVGEDVAEKILSFAQQRPRALCILSAKGSVSVVTLRQSVSSGSTITYEGRFEILCLSGSYLVAESGGPRNRTGGISISFRNNDGHIVGGAIGGRLIAASPVQVVVSTFVYGGSKAQEKTEPHMEHEKNTAGHSAEDPSIPNSAVRPQTVTPNSAMNIWPPVSRQDQKTSRTGIDLTHG